MFQRKVISEEEIAMYNCMINDTCCYIYNLIKNRPLYSPINKMDSFLLSFLSNWYNKRRNSHEVVKDEFDIFVRKGWLPRYNKGFEYTRNEEYAITINFTEEGYYEYLEKSYFRHFCNPSENSYAWNCRPNNMIKLINIIKDVVGNDILNKIFNDVTSDKNSRLQKDSLLQKYHRDGKLNEVYTWDTMKRVIVDTFPIEDIVLPYDKWKFNIELAPDRLKRGLFYSLFYNSPKNYSQREILVTQLYYKPVGGIKLE